MSLLVARSFSHWKGFEKIPEGRLLQQIVSISGDMGHAYERSVDFYKSFHTHDRLMLVFPRMGCTMDVSTADGKEFYSVDSTSVLSVPKSCLHDDRSTSSVYDTLALYPSDDLIHRVSMCFGSSASKLSGSRLLSECIKVKRSRWLNELVDRYFQEFIFPGKLSDPEGRFFEKRILLEFISLASAAVETDFKTEFEQFGESALHRARENIETSIGTL